MVLTIVLLATVLWSNTKRLTQEKNSKPTLAITPPALITQPPPDIDPTVAAIPTQETGGNMTVTLTSNEQSFGDLFFKVPLDMQTFIVDFDYAENKFSVLIFADAGEQAYYKWRKDSYPALTDDQFILIDKRI